MIRSFVNHAFRLTGAVLLASALGCGGGGGGTAPDTGPKPPVPTLAIKGTAASGTPLLGTVTVKDASSPAITRVAPIQADGSYIMDMAGLKAPFLFRADGEVSGRRVHYYSGAVASDVGGTLNITPFTDLIMAMIARDVADNLEAQAGLTALTPEALRTQAEALRLQLLPVLQALGLPASLDLLRTSFAADHTGLDAALDVLKVSLDPATKAAKITNLLNGSTSTQDLVSGQASGALDPAGVQAGSRDFQGIVKGFQALSSLYRNRVPAEAELRALNFFDTSSDFCQNGQGFEAFLSDLVLNTPKNFEVRGVRLGSVKDDRMTVVFDLFVEGGKVDTSFFLFRRQGDGTYRALGNGILADIKLDIRAVRTVEAGKPEDLATGVQLKVRDTGNRFGGRGAAVLTAPDGTKQTYYQTITSSCFSIDPKGDETLFRLTDAQIQAVPDTDSRWKVTLHQILSDGTWKYLTTCTFQCPVRPLKRTELDASRFATLKRRTPADLKGFTGGTIQAEWALPQGHTFDFGGLAFGSFEGAHNVWVAGKMSGQTLAVDAPASLFAGWPGGVQNWRDILVTRDPQGRLFEMVSIVVPR